MTDFATQAAERVRKAKVTDKEQRIINALSRGACLTAAQLAERLGGGTGSMYRSLNKLYNEGILTCWKAHPDDSEYLWATDDPKYPTVKVNEKSDKSG